MIGHRPPGGHFPGNDGVQVQRPYINTKGQLFRDLESELHQYHTVSGQGYGESITKQGALDETQEEKIYLDFSTAIH